LLENKYQNYLNSHTVGYCNIFLTLAALPANNKILFDSKSIKESDIVANNEREPEEIAAYNCSPNKTILTAIDPSTAILSFFRCKEQKES
jgi:hypothetical protein